MTQFLQQLTNGVVLGATYGLIALGYTMVYGIIQLINFAHGDIFMLGAFGGLALYNVLPHGMQDQVLIALPLCTLAGIALSVAVAVVMERVAYRPLRNAPRLAPLITAIGVSAMIEEGTRLWYPGAKAPLTFPPLLPSGGFTVGGVRISYASLVVVIVAVVLMIALQAFVLRSRTGRAMRATAQDPDTAKLMGINTDRVIVITFILGAALAAVAGVLNGARLGTVQFNDGFVAGLKAFTAAVLGGIGNITGCVAGGFILGIVEVMAVQYLPNGSGYKDLWAFVVLILVLVFRPTGLFGEEVTVRA
ncbi:MAG TPA: branched-chain amino acid ABC transporter permease [Mycobacteriales bacterium]|nr:branched-chain amino acid ABC transporter permease [Mycobacteriales bacterium]